MSRIGKQFITIPERVNIKLEGQKVSIDGPKGSLSRILQRLLHSFSGARNNLKLGPAPV